MKPLPESSTVTAPRSYNSVIDRAFGNWWRFFLEGSLWISREFLDPNQPDLGLLYIAAYQLLIDAVATTPAALSRAEASDIDKLIAEFPVADYGSWSINSFSDITGIPRDTAKRDLEKLTSMGLFARDGERRYRLSHVSGDIIKLSRPCFGLCKWLLHLSDMPVCSFQAPRNALNWGGLMRQYLGAYLDFAKSRRLETGPQSHLSLQIAIMVLAERRLQDDECWAGPRDLISRSEHAKRLALFLRGPFSLRSCSDLTGMTMARVRKIAIRIARVNRNIILLDADTFAISEEGIDLSNLGEHRRFYTHEMELRMLQLETRLISITH